MGQEAPQIPADLDRAQTALDHAHVAQPISRSGLIIGPSVWGTRKVAGCPFSDHPRLPCNPASRVAREGIRSRELRFLMAGSVVRQRGLRRGHSPRLTRRPRCGAVRQVGRDVDEAFVAHCDAEVLRGAGDPGQRRPPRSRAWCRRQLPFRPVRGRSRAGARGESCDQRDRAAGDDDAVHSSGFASLGLSRVESTIPDCR